ncbi:MAG: potassium/proton antiporter [Bacteriovoracaceae bacterium]|nr:potassium/proton antiporter [Bacteriovoracaceae bacterium]
MEDILNNSLLLGSIILLASVLISKSSNKFGLPILILFLGIGMLAGSEGLGGINYENYELTHSASLIAICLIIFSGGLLTKKDEMAPVLKSGVSLASLGIVITTMAVGAFCYFVLKTPVFESLLIGSILSSTDAAAVFTALRDKNAQVSKNVKSLLELESGSNDPMAYLLVTIFLGLHQAKLSLDSEVALMVILNPLIGLILGYVLYRAFKFVNDKIELDFQGLYPALMFGFVFLTYSVTTRLEGNGFLAVYLFAIQVGNSKIVHKSALVTFFDGVSWLAQIGLFILLGLLVFPSRLMEVAPIGMLLALFLVLIARPLSVFISLAFSKLNTKSKLFVSWAGLKGATPIVFAAFVSTEIGTNANLIFDMVFFSVLISALLQGTTLKPVAKKLGLLFESVYDPDFPVDLETIEKTRNGIKELRVHEGDYAVGSRIVDIRLPKGALILFIKRGGGFVIPNGSTTFEVNDKVLLVTPQKDEIQHAENCFKGIYKDDTPEEVHSPNPTESAI